MPDGLVTRYALQGRVVTMDAHLNIVDPGKVYIDKNKISAVRPANALPPAGFENAPVIQTDGTIYPGLIELHNHLSYNILPLWSVPKKFANRARWSGHIDKLKLITGPMQVLGHTRGFPEAIVRYVEGKCLLSGVTTSQGITLAGVGLDRYYKGIVRNVEKADNPALPNAKTRVQDVVASDVASFYERLKHSTCLLLHLSEGSDDISRRAFEALHLPGGDWAITEALGGIHCAALFREHFKILKDHRGSVIWSPLSNLLLYQHTADVRAAKEEGLTIALGSDWSPSGSKNLLGELKVAYLVSQSLGNLFSPEELVAMATANPARILKWQNALGSIQDGWLADLLVLAGNQGNAYEQLIQATEASVALVVIDGLPRYGRPPLMAPFGAGTEQIQIGGEPRTLNLNDPNANLDIQNLTLDGARQRLQDGLRRLPELALAQENAIAQGGAIGFDAVANETYPTLALDEDMLQTESPRLLVGGEVTALKDLIELLASVKYSELLKQVIIELDPLTMVDDRTFFPCLAGQPNLELELKQGLANYYGAQLPTPDGGGFIRRINKAVRSQFWTATDLPAFQEKGGYLSLADRQRIVEQALVLLERVYVHLPFKRAMHAVDPVQRLKLLQYHLEQLQYEPETQPDRQMPPEIEFHKEMTDIFTSLRDLHTNYLLPEPYQDKIAFLPFLIEEYFEERDAKFERKYMVSKILSGFHSPHFAKGVEVLYWNGVPIHRAVELNAELQAGSNPDARLARGLESLTVRPLVRSLPPEEEWVSLRYRTEEGKEHELRQKWLVFSPQASPGGVDADSGLLPATALGFDLQTDVINLAKKLLYAPKAVQAEREILESGTLPSQKPAVDEELVPTTMPTVFRAKPEVNELGAFGYIRIFTFNVQDDQAFVNEFIRLAQALPQGGLIIDVRNNGGGLIYAAERLLQVMTARQIEPQRAQFINTPLTQEICRQHSPSPVFQGLDLSPWIASIRQAVETGAAYSLGFPITPPDSCNDIGQKYERPVVLITDALCYSATDIFTAGFQDHQIGKILGTSGNTGAGGANVWTHAVLDRLMSSPGPEPAPLPTSPFKPLPYGAGMRVAVRRTLRVGNQAGVPVEDLGVVPDVRYYMTKDDLLYGNTGLIWRACQLLVEQGA